MVSLLPDGESAADAQGPALGRDRRGGGPGAATRDGRAQRPQQRPADLDRRPSRGRLRRSRRARRVRRARRAARLGDEVGERRKLVIVGSGPAGYTAAIYAARAELAPVVVAGLKFGGQLMLTTEVENYPGFPEGVSGPEMMELFQKQAERFGAEVLLEDATRVELGERPFRIETASRVFLADAVI